MYLQKTILGYEDSCPEVTQMFICWPLKEYDKIASMYKTVSGILV